GNMSGFEVDEFIQNVYRYCNSEDVSVIFYITDIDKKTYYEYIASSQSLSSLYGLTGKTDDTFSDINSTITVTNHKNDVVHFDCFHTDWDVQYISFNQFSRKVMPPGTYLLFHLLVDDIRIGNKVALELVQQYKSYGLTILDMSHQTETDYKSEIQQKLLISLLFLIGILVVLFLFYLSDQLKNITVYKLNGYEGISVFWGLIGRELLQAAFVSVLAAIVLYVTLIGFFSNAAYEFIRVIIFGFISIYAIIILLTLVFSLEIRSFSLSSMLKGKNANNQISFAAYVLKFVISMITIPLILSHYSCFSEYWEAYQLIHKYERLYKDTYRVVAYASDYSYLNAMYSEWSDQTEDPQYLKEIALVDSFVDSGAYYAEPGQISLYPESIGCSVVNLNYFINEFPESKEKEIIIQKVKNGKTVFVLSNQYGDSLENALKNIGTIIPIDEPMISEMNFRLPMFADIEMEAEALQVIPNGEPLKDKVITRFFFLKGFTPERIEEILSQNGMGGMLVYQKVLDDTTLPYIRWLILEQVLWIAAYSFLLVLNAYSFFITYRNANRKKTAVQTLHGYRFFQLYWDYLLEAFLIYVPVVIFYKQPVWEVIVIAVIVEIVCMIPAFIKARKTGLVSLLKAEEEFA
ncbi:MAG: hypothetical protein IIZ48_04430, partial [Erysipelotrichales bacterium]|nr:hypothetical protein [Erysipelotrichales bacterium]